MIVLDLCTRLSLFHVDPFLILIRVLFDCLIKLEKFQYIILRLPTLDHIRLAYPKLRIVARVLSFVLMCSVLLKELL